MDRRAKKRDKIWESEIEQKVMIKWRFWCTQFAKHSLVNVFSATIIIKIGTIEIYKLSILCYFNKCFIA